MNAYVVEVGEYSDVQVLAVFTDLDQAKRWTRRQYDESGAWGRSLRISSVPLNPPEYVGDDWPSITPEDNGMWVKYDGTWPTPRFSDAEAVLP